MTSMDLDEHLDAIAAGDPDAFERWVAGAEHPLRLSLRSFATRVDVEAVMQEGLLRVWNVAPRVERDGAPNALLRVALRIVRNLAIDEVRRARSVPLDDDDRDASAGFATAAAMPDPMLREAIRHCSDRLPPRPRQALTARIDAQGGAPDRTLAQQLGMELNTFLQNVTRARRLLADCLRGRGIDLGELA
jgi:RNA polymerase sigma-70 factor (ECF subfamily)